MADAAASIEDERLFCYRHPDRETYVRCGRCDRPICSRCAMQGPVGFRCRQCGTLANDPLTSFSPRQLVLGFVVAVGLAAVAGLLASRIGFLSVVVGFFAGGIIAEAVTRVLGFKRGPVMLALVLSAIIVGTLVGFSIGYGLYLMEWGDLIASEEFNAGVTGYLVDSLLWSALAVGAACVGAYSRLRY